MKLKTLIPTLILLTFISCEKDENSINPSVEISPVEIEVSYNANTFGLKLFRELSKLSPDSNVIISPFSVSTALAMAWNGASGETEKAMRDVLELGNFSEEEVNNAYKNLLDYFLNLDSETILRFANSVWKHIPIPVLDSFIDICRKYFYAEFRELDFGAPGAVDSINNWIAEKTEDKITNALDYIPKETVMYIINALYFKGSWKYQFDKSYTSPGYFYDINDNRIPCKMMVQTNDFTVNRTEKFTAVKLPYSDEKFVMVIILPENNTPINQFVSNLTLDKWNEIIGNSEELKATLKMPRMKIKYKNLLNKALTNLGMDIAFTGMADFSKIFGDTGYWINRVIHNTFLEVNEEGTEAAAATIVEFCRSGGGGENIPFIIIDRPFVFAIYEEETEAILFIGKVTAIPEET